MSDLILKIENISYSVQNSTFTKGNGPVEIIKDISFDVPRGKIIGISGESGSGKSTLAKIIVGIYSPTSGRINKFFKKNWQNVSSNPIQILFQNDGNLINPRRKVKDIFNETFEIKYKSKKDYSEEINSLINFFGLNNNILNSRGDKLSGGEQQRLAMIRLMIVEPEILVLDEPFSSQDPSGQISILNFINNARKDNALTVICISHNLKILSEFSNELLIVWNGTLVESGNTSEVLSNPRHDYTRFLLSAQSLNLSAKAIENFQEYYEQDQRNKNT